MLSYALDRCVRYRLKTRINIAFAFFLNNAHLMKKKSFGLIQFQIVRKLVF